MNDFLHNLRTGKFKRQERNSRPYADPQNKSAQWRGDNDKRKGPNHTAVALERITSVINETIPEIKTTLAEIAENQKILAGAFENSLRAQERTADAMEIIAEILKQQFGNGQKPNVSEADAGETGVVSEPRKTEEEPAEIKSANDNDQLIKNILEMKKEGMSYENIAQHLDAEGIPTLSGRGKWRGQTVSKVCRQIESV